jgi:amino acid adenylation domain-containing protein
MGVFINTLVLRATINGAESFTELLARVRQVVLDAIAHQDLPFEKLVEELKPVRDLSRTPLFQVVFNLQSAPMPDLAMEGLDTSFWKLDTGVSQFEITLMLTRQGEGYHAVVEYNRHLFDASTIQRMFESFERLLLQVIECPEKEVSHYLIVSAEEMNKWADTFNQTGMELPQQHFFHRLFEQQVTLTPEAPAVVCGEVQLSYFDLNRQADMLAAGLRQYGFRNGTRIAVLMKRSADILVALLGIHKAGCTYVPLSTSFPRDRILFILQDAEVQALVSNYDCGISERDVAKVIRTDEPSDEPLKEISSVDLRPEDIAYLIYTSGSTGLPKGVMIQHGSLVNFLWSMRGRPGIMQGDRLMAVTSVSFDIAALELFLPIIAGATVVIATEEMLARPDMLAKALDQYEINIMQATPAIWQLMIETGWQGRKELKALCGGEAMPLNLAQQLLDRVESLWNMYGPTETTIWSSVNKISKGDTVITIGRPIANTQLYVLDNYGQVAPTGVMGELLIGGYGLAQGYVNLPHLTEEKFIKDHITGKPGARLYKTGDLARYLPCGSIEISGRMDDQVKINGNRIELGEIAWHLLHHPAVKDCVVCKRSMHEGGQYLIAYLLTVEGLQPDISELKAFLSKKLPPYMIPSSFVTLPSFPLSPNGKIDRKALPLPGTSLQRTGYVAPVTDQEKILVAIWQNILHLEQVGICDNFFDLGGASMQSMQMVARANMLGLKLSVEHVFEHQTIAELSAFLKQESL